MTVAWQPWLLGKSTSENLPGAGPPSPDILSSSHRGLAIPVLQMRLPSRVVSSKEREDSNPGSAPGPMKLKYGQVGHRSDICLAGLPHPSGMWLPHRLVTPGPPFCGQGCWVWTGCLGSCRTICRRPRPGPCAMRYNKGSSPVKSKR